MDSFGAELRRLRERAGISLSQLARQVHYSKGHLSKVESGHKPPSAQLARLCDSAVGAGGSLIRLVADGVPEPSGPSGQAPSGEFDQDMWTLGVSSGGSGFFLPGQANGVPKASGMSFGVSAEPVDTDFAVEAFRARFASARTLGQVAGPAMVLPLVIADAQTLRAVAAGAPPDNRTAVWRLAARYAEFAGWMTQEAGDDRMAMWWTDTAVKMAGLGGDHTLEAYALVRRAEIALHNDDALTTISLAQRAQRSEHATERVRGLAAQREAQGHALAGDHDACLSALERAATLLASGGAEQPGLTLGTTNTPDLGTLVGGWCLYDLGRPGEAAEILDRGILRFAPGAHRAKARFLTRAALAYGSAGELDRACGLMAEALDGIRVLDSATIRRDLKDLVRVLARWRSHPEARELRGRLLAALRTPEP
ncbi:MAG TPA: helix-turn-helix transcriptional regulator [Amycolatopsis sp.]|uniref:helix-turn-helix domain-containing protein n=1 Tax=Amycolatopsis sp. TaxID=37632 RepID=UPI002B4A8B11|nr:helix-turn-helix transcriptional regulator [Amycolatopsis sp.]HKS48327.1 helix-turn-helix transcriptional regulator [Amycolatopsis sp.]